MYVSMRTKVLTSMLIPSVEGCEKARSRALRERHIQIKIFRLDHMRRGAEARYVSRKPDCWRAIRCE